MCGVDSSTLNACSPYNNNFYSKSEVELSIGDVLKGVLKPDSQSLSWTFVFKTVLRICLI